MGTPDLVVEGDGGALHRDGAALLLVEVVHEAEPPRELRVEDAAAARGDEVVGERGLAVVDVGQDADVPDPPTRRFFPFHRPRPKLEAKKKGPLVSIGIKLGNPSKKGSRMRGLIAILNENSCDLIR